MHVFGYQKNDQISLCIVLQWFWTRKLVVEYLTLHVNKRHPVPFREKVSLGLQEETLIAPCLPHLNELRCSSCTMCITRNRPSEQTNNQPRNQPTRQPNNGLSKVLIKGEVLDCRFDIFWVEVFLAALPRSDLWWGDLSTKHLKEDYVPRWCQFYT